MNVGTNDRRKVIALAVLGVGAAYAVYTNLLAGPSIPAAEHPAPAVEKVAAPESVGLAEITPRKASRPSLGRINNGEFHPVYIAKRPEDRPDPTTIDPTLRLELLEKVQEVDAADGARNLFAFGKPAPKAVELPSGPEPNVRIKTVADGVKSGGPSGPPPDPPPPPINLKYYGIVAYSQGGKKTACFLDGDEILLAVEGDTLKRRYRLTHIGTGSVSMYDSESKREQNVPLAPEVQGS